MHRRLLVLGDAPCLEQDISGLVLEAYDVAVVNAAGLRFTGPIRFWVTYHASDMVNRKWCTYRENAVGYEEYTIVLHASNQRVLRAGKPVEIFSGPGTTGSSTLLAVLYGLQRAKYDSVTVAGAPLLGEYSTFRDGWIMAKRILAGRVQAMSGWTQTFLEGLC